MTMCTTPFKQVVHGSGGLTAAISGMGHTAAVEEPQGLPVAPSRPLAPDRPSTAGTATYPESLAYRLKNRILGPPKVSEQLLDNLRARITLFHQLPDAREPHRHQRKFGGREEPVQAHQHQYGEELQRDHRGNELTRSGCAGPSAIPLVYQAVAHSRTSAVGSVSSGVGGPQRRNPGPQRCARELFASSARIACSISEGFRPEKPPCNSSWRT